MSIWSTKNAGLELFNSSHFLLLTKRKSQNVFLGHRWGHSDVSEINHKRVSQRPEHLQVLLNTNRTTFFQSAVLHFQKGMILRNFPCGRTCQAALKTCPSSHWSMPSYQNDHSYWFSLIPACSKGEMVKTSVAPLQQKNLSLCVPQLDWSKEGHGHETVSRTSARGVT